MRPRLTQLYPFLIAIIPILNFAGSNPSAFKAKDLAFTIAVAVVWCAAVHLLALLVIGRRGPPALVPFVVLLAVGWFYGYGLLVGKLSPDKTRPHHALVLAGLVLLGTGLLLWIRRRERLLDGVARFVALMGTLLVSWGLFRIGIGWIRGMQAVEESALVSELARPIETAGQARRPMRDIYFIVLDEYPNSEVLRERFKYDNRPFEDSLRALGFQVPHRVQSNYLHTLLSLPSVLNAVHMTGLEGELGPKATSPAVPNHLLEHHRVAAFLKGHGYRYLFFPSQWWHSTRSSEVADVVFHPYHGFRLTRALSEGELQRALRTRSALRYLDPDHGWEADHVRRTMEGLAQVPQAPGPVFVFAHVLKPHSPFVFHRGCETVRRQQRSEDIGGPYLEQLECVNRMLLATVRRILRDSRVPPIILLQGDHGTNLLDATGFARADQVPPEAARERFGALGAYYLPDGGAAAFGDTVTLVNVLGNVLRYYLGADLPRAADEQYISPADFPYAFRKVDARWLAGDDSAGVTALGAGR
jgi:hypothetical protein